MKTIEVKNVKGSWNEKYYSSTQDEVRIYINNREIHCKKNEIKEVDGYGQSWTSTKNDICTKCGKQIVIGNEIRYRYNGGKHLEHTNCEQGIIEIQKYEKIEKSYINVSNHYSSYTKGEVIYNWSTKQYLVVISSNSQYFNEEDCMSFGRMEAGYIYSAKCRLATEEEANTIKKEIEKQITEEEEEKIQKKIREDAKNKMNKIIEQIRKQENLPDEKNIILEGEKYCDSQNIYGSGDWFVITEKEIWYVQNNGMDGDNWSYNNVRTGGAGAIGWRIIRQEKIVERIKKIDMILFPKKQ